MKFFFFIFSLLTVHFYNSQQTESLRIIHEKYVPEFENIEKKYKNINTKKLSKKELEELSLKREKEINTLEFKRNEEYLSEFLKMKSGTYIVNIDNKKIVPIDEKGEVSAAYPQGINAFRKEIVDNFYAGTIDTKGNIRTELIFVIERDGSIVDVKATGPNGEFNKQAELAVYLTKHKWQPARINGYSVRYRLRVPLNLNFD